MKRVVRDVPLWKDTNLFFKILHVLAKLNNGGNMSLESVKIFFIASGTKSWEVTKAFVIWSGRCIKNGWCNYVVPSVVKVATVIFNFLKTGYGIATLALTGAFLLHVLANQKFSHDQDRDIRHVINLIAAGLIFAAGFIAAVYTVGPVAVV